MDKKSLIRHEFLNILMLLVFDIQEHDYQSSMNRLEVARLIVEYEDLFLKGSMPLLAQERRIDETLDFVLSFIREMEGRSAQNIQLRCKGASLTWSYDKHHLEKSFEYVVRNMLIFSKKITCTVSENKTIEFSYVSKHVFDFTPRTCEEIFQKTNVKEAILLGLDVARWIFHLHGITVLSRAGKVVFTFP